MVLFNYSTRELTAKIVFYGPGLCGKTTNLQYIYGALPEGVKKGKMLSLATKTDRTLFFDFLPIELGTIRGMRTRVQLYTVPGQVFYNSTRKLVLKGADGVVFVADSQARMLDANIESYKNLEDNLLEMGIRLEEVPLVMQFNKQDLPNLASIEEMNTRVNRHNAPFYEAVATTGIGVEDTLKAIMKLVLNNLASKYKLEAAPPAEPFPEEEIAPPPADEIPVAVQEAPAVLPMPEDAALDALEVDYLPAEPTPSPAADAEIHASPIPPAEVAGGIPAPPEEIIDLVEEITEPEPTVALDETIDLEDELLQDLDEGPAPVVMHPAAARPAYVPEPPTHPAADLRSPPQVSAALAEEPIDLDEPIDLGEPLPQVAATTPTPIPGGALSPGESREIEVPVTVTVGGKTLLIHLKIGLRLSD